MPTSVLFIGGTGIISWSCVKAALAAGHQVTVLNRGQSRKRPVPDGAELVVADMHQPGSAAAALAGRSFGVVADFISYTPDQLQASVELLKGRTGQYIYISSAAAYRRWGLQPITEGTTLANPYWQYGRDKIACEEYLVGLIRAEDFPATIVRPSHTYDAAYIPTLGEWTDIARARAGKPIMIHGDGTAQWTLTHAEDFAFCFNALIGDWRAIGEPFQITGDEALPWNQIHTELAHAAGVPDPRFVHVPSDAILAADPDEGAGLLGDKAHSVTFDCSKVRRLAHGFRQRIPFSEGARQIVAWYDAHPEYQVINERYDRLCDSLVAKYA
ncbi:MAG: NAD-dependent epimerase/dehydratase family protein [Bifidobacteriaceae bacterium]|jgi:nucleoside-diphosphate-sugar epimerase|nr:NAD-dependent epimerase/dehydratase family protein [Bifidobacteriaceae bacterium]